MIRYHFWHSLNIIVYVFRLILMIISAICWCFVVSNLINRIVPQYVYLIASKDTAVGHAILWFINNVYLQHIWLQYGCVFLQAKAFYIAVLTSLLLRPVARVVNYTYYKYVQIANTDPHVGWVLTKKRMKRQGDVAGNNKNVDNTQIQLLQTQLENERLKNQILRQQISRANGSPIPVQNAMKN